MRRTVDIPEDTEDAVGAIADATGASRAMVIRILLAWAVEAYHKAEPVVVDAIVRAASKA